ncbi:MAG: FtsX-like permease family protein [Lachnospiraceae bacterium]|jgi:putative ABC transport system permease protein
MLCKLSLKNIQKSFRDYLVYFFTLIIGVAIFYVFNAIDSQTVMLDITESTKNIIKLMLEILSGVSVFVSFVLGFLIVYANRFLMKRRNKEFGLYLMLGMGKRKISMILFLETLFVGCLSMVAGLLMGIGLSQLMSVFVADMFDADMNRFQFVFSMSACRKTVLYFAVMYLVVMIFNTFSISKCKLIDLLQYAKKTEQVKIRNPWICTVIFVIAAGILGYAYWLVSGSLENFETPESILQPIILGIVATFLIFWSLSGLLLRIIMTWKRVYYKGLNSFTLRQFSSQINTMVISVSVICLMLFVTICVLTSGLSIRNSMSANLDSLAPADIQITKRIYMDDSWMEDEYTETEAAIANLDVRETYAYMGNPLDQYLGEYVEFYTYQTPELTMGDTIGDQIEEVKKSFSMLNYDSQEDIVKISDYNKLAKLYGQETYSLEEDEYMIIADFQAMAEVRNRGLASEQEITVWGQTLQPKYTECKPGIIDMSSNHINTGVILVPDEVAEEGSAARSYLVANYNVKDKAEKIELEEELFNLDTDIDREIYAYLGVNTRLDIAEASTGLGAMGTFIGLYLGIVFLISSAAILALKQLSESADNRERYGMLRKLGADENMIHRALFLQIGSFFLFPLVLALIHSIFGLKFCNTVLEILGNEQMWASFLMTMGVLVLIYGGYFIITYFCSRNIIKDR